jgi:hypothetical protein
LSDHLTSKKILFLVSICDFKISEQENDSQFDYFDSKLLPKPVLQSSLKWPPKVLSQVQLMSWKHEPALREEFLYAWPIL